MLLLTRFYLGDYGDPHQLTVKGFMGIRKDDFIVIFGDHWRGIITEQQSIRGGTGRIQSDPMIDLK